MGYSFLQLSLEEEIEVRSWLAATEIEERRKEIEREEKGLKGKEESLRQKAKEIENTVIEAKWVAAQLQLMAGQLDCLGNQILEETKKLKKSKSDLLCKKENTFIQYIKNKRKLVLLISHILYGLFLLHGIHSI